MTGSFRPERLVFRQPKYRALGAVVVMKSSEAKDLLFVRASEPLTRHSSSVFQNLTNPL